MPRYLPRKARQHREALFASKLIKNNFRLRDTVLEMGITKNPNSAHVIAHRLLHSVTCEKRLQQHMKKAKISADEVLEELSSIARAPVEKYTESAKLKALELSGKAHKLFTDKLETSSDQTETKLHISSEIQALSEDLGKSEAEIELEMQLRFANRLRKSYDPSLDPTVHPEVWKSGNLLRDKEIEAESESVS